MSSERIRPPAPIPPSPRVGPRDQNSPIILAALGLKLTHGQAPRGDFGATHGEKSGKETLLRTHWNNQTTGIVNDEVFELRMEPKNWRELEFRN
ncbi:MAG: hypothetical protein FJ288_18615 [Planctomycetes bacterium]|nr:hypothetical protein [Planctomycetota bacterium]